jgi:hypothetical protein
MNAAWKKAGEFNNNITKYFQSRISPHKESSFSHTFHNHEDHTPDRKQRFTDTSAPLYTTNSLVSPKAIKSVAQTIKNYKQSAITPETILTR